MRKVFFVTAIVALSACHGTSENGKADTEKQVEGRPTARLDPNPPMSSRDIDAIVEETRTKSAIRTPQAVSNEADAHHEENAQ